MTPLQAILDGWGDLIAADTATLAPAVSANKIALIMSAFTPTQQIQLTDFTLATFTGSTPIAGATGAQQRAIDPLTADELITIKEPAGGWRWVTGDTANL